MAPPVAIETATTTAPPAAALKLNQRPADEADLTAFDRFDSTPVIGTEFRKVAQSDRPTLSIREVLADDAKVKALGRLVSERGVVFFRDAEITTEEQKTLVTKMGLLGGKPPTSGLHVHPLSFSGAKWGDEISLISSEYVFTEEYKMPKVSNFDKDFNANNWHSDVTYETVPSDYACLQIRTVPETGGDTMWASAYEAYDRLSPAMQVFLEGLTATHVGRVFLDIATKLQLPVREPRGSPLNVGQDLKSSHPVIRTHPITGWRGLFVNKEFTTRINEVSKTESDMLLEYLFRVVALNQNLQVRFHWEPNSLAIWDNRCTWHAITFDVDNVKREGSRALSLGEQPFFDPKSVSRQTALAAQAKAAAAA